MQQTQQNAFREPDNSDRRNRFVEDSTILSIRERASSQPPRTTGLGFISPHHPTSPIYSGSHWIQQQRLIPSLNPVARPSSSVRSISFNRNSQIEATQAQYIPQMRETRQFDSTYECDETDSQSEPADERYFPPTSDDRGRSTDYDISRSRSQSLATGIRTGPIRSPLQSSGLWMASSSANIPSNQARFGDLQPPYSERLSQNARFHDTRTYSNRGTNNSSNMSPLGRDLDHILRDDNRNIRDIWPSTQTRVDAGNAGTASRRHSVSVVQPRRESQSVIGFNPTGNDYDETSNRPSAYSQIAYGHGAAALTDDDLAADLNTLNLHEGSTTSSAAFPLSQPSSLPIFAATSRSPLSAGRVSPYQSYVRYPTGQSFSNREHYGSPSESGFSGTAGSPAQSSRFDATTDYPIPAAHFTPGEGIHYLPLSRGDEAGRTITVGASTIYGQSGGRPVSMQSPHMVHQRQSSDTPSLSELGKGVPLHSVPASWPLFIVEFKAGRTDLFYSTDPALDLHMGDLVIVEADRGKDLGKVINDSITLKEVEVFQQQQLARLAFGDGHAPMSPGASLPNVKKDISPKMIYGKATTQEAQQLADKVADEQKALQLCQTKVRQRKLPMEVVDAEYQLDRKKLTFYYVAQMRVDFRELVRELFRLYKTRIWMAPLQGSVGFD